MKTARTQMTGFYLVLCSFLIAIVYLIANCPVLCTKLVYYSLFLSGSMTALFGISMILFPSRFETGTKALQTVWCSILVIAVLAGVPAYMNRDTISCSVAQCQVFSAEPAGTEGNVAYFTYEQLGELALESIPVRITRKTRDGMPHFSNESRFVDSWVERLIGRYFPTHFIAFTLITVDAVKGRVLFRMDLAEIDGSPLILSPPSIRGFDNYLFIDEGISLGEYLIGETRPLMLVSGRWV